MQTLKMKKLLRTKKYRDCYSRISSGKRRRGCARIFPLTQPLCFVVLFSFAFELRFLLGVTYCTGFADNGDFYLARVGHFVLYLFGDIEGK